MTVRIRVKGAVQGIGYRPFIYQKATEYGLLGQVKNIGAAVEIIVAGDGNIINEFAKLLENEAPVGALILDVKKEQLTDCEYSFKEFSIVESSIIDLTSELPVFLPDIGICDDCMKELLDSNDRRYKYPLISCASCGPRISIINNLPYDRDTTTMEDFKMCPKCQNEYGLGRRKHAQTISCHDCGPQMLLDRFENGDVISFSKEESIEKAIELLNDGKILGLKGISGYQLICKPLDAVVNRLRLIKGRENKPFALLFSNIEKVKEYAKVNSLEEKLLLSSARPIVLLDRKYEFPSEVCKDSDYIGAFLASAGIHRLLCDAVGPLICTSANISGQPMVIEDDAFRKIFFEQNELHIDGVLYHKRKINMPQDDSVMFVISDANGNLSSQFIRRARGFAPLPVLTDKTHNNRNYLCFGGDLKSTFALAKKDRIIPSQFIGDLEDADTYYLYKDLIKRYCELFAFVPERVICDKHPLYHSVQFANNYAEENGIEVTQIQHHHAHVLSVMAENSLTSCIGVSFDGTGFGDDGKIWGGEILYCQNREYKRSSHLSYVKLLGGENAPKDASNVKECYDIALGNGKNPLIKAALLHNINTYETSSAGRLFDAVAALLGIKSYNSFEGECAISLEKKASESDKSHIPDFEIKLIENQQGEFEFNQLYLYAQISNCLNDGTYDTSDIAYGFHMALSKYILKVCSILREKTSETKVCLSGGVFANRILLRNTIALLSKEGFNVYWNKLVPAGDSGISLGQAYYGLLSEE